MKNTYKLLLLLAVAFFCYSCEESELNGAGKSEMTVTLPEGSLEHVSFTSEGESQTIYLTANSNWSAIVSNIEDELWVNIDVKEGGAGEDHAIIITAQPNPSLYNRDSEVILVCGATPLKVVVKQGQSLGIAVPVGKEEITLNKTQPSMEVLINANVTIEIEIEDAHKLWLSCKPTPATSSTTKSTKTQSFTITALTNYRVERIGEVIFKNTETQTSDTITVVQPNVGTGSIEIVTLGAITGEAQDFNIKVNAVNIEGLSAAISDITGNITGNWITSDTPPVKVVGEEAFIFTFTVLLNPVSGGTKDRKAKITFTDINNSGMTKSLDVTQAIKQDKLEIAFSDPDAANLNANWETSRTIFANPFASTTYTFTISTEKIWTLASDNTGFVANQNGAIATNLGVTVTIPANTNPGSEDKSATLTFTSGDNVQEVTISQKMSKITINYTAGTLGEAISALPAHPYGIRNLIITGTKEVVVDDFASLNAITTLTDLNLSQATPISTNNAIIPFNAFQEHPALANVKLFESFTGPKNFGQNAFRNCKQLKTISIPEGFGNITNNAFQGCIALGPKIDLPASLTNIGANAFNGCSALTVVNIQTTAATTAVNANSFSGATNALFYVYDVAAYSAFSNWKAAFFNGKIKPHADLPE